MHVTFVAVWYDRRKVHDRARQRGWKEDEGGLLDAYHPEEDPSGHEAREFKDLSAAVAHLMKIITAGQDFWGQAKVREIEVGGSRCRYCSCRGYKCVREHIVEADGVVQTEPYDECG